MRQMLIAMCVGALAAAPAGGQTRPAIEMGDPVKLNFAGVKFSLPKDFPLNIPGDPFTIVQAVKIEEGEPVLAVTLSAWPQAKGVTLAGLIESVDPSKSLAVRHMKVVKTIPVKFAGLAGRAQVQTYTYRGVATTAVRLYFLRSLAKLNVQLGYVLTVEAGKDRGQRTLPVLTAVARTLEFFDPASPCAESAAELAPPVVSQAMGYSIRPPLWWKTSRNAEGTRVDMYQTDYTRGLRMPQAMLNVRIEGDPAGDCAARELSQLVANFKRNKQEFTILRQGKAKLGGRDGYEFVLRHGMPGGDKNWMNILTQRTACAHGRAYSLLLVYQTGDPAVPAATMEKLAAGVKLSEPKVPATGPASRPASAPATRPAGK